MRRIVPHSTSREPTYWRPATRTAKTPRRQPAATVANHGETPPVEADFFVVVMGDTLGDMLADGLEEAFEDFPEIGVLHKGKESSGLVRNDFYDWPKTAQEIANGPRKPDVAVMMLGSNDHQALDDGAQAVGAFLAALARGLYGPGGGRYPRLQGKEHSARLGGAPDDESGALFGRYGANQRNLSLQRGQAPAFPSSTSGTSSPTITVSTAPSAPTLTARTSNCAPPTACISPARARARSRISSRAKSSGCSTRASNRRPRRPARPPRRPEPSPPLPPRPRRCFKRRARQLRRRRPACRRNVRRSDRRSC